MTDQHDKDRLYADAQKVTPDFVFDERVAAVFPDMIQRSVPGYATIINMIGTLASRSVKPGTRCYDLGCSLGAAALAMHQGMGAQTLPIVAVDNSQPMLDRAKELLAKSDALPDIELRCADVLDVTIENASMVVLNFTLQFIEPAERARLLGRIYEGLQPGGILVLSEKIALPSDAMTSRIWANRRRRTRIVCPCCIAQTVSSTGWTTGRECRPSASGCPGS